jgi:hypothetical protein
VTMANTYLAASLKAIVSRVDLDRERRKPTETLELYKLYQRLCKVCRACAVQPPAAGVGGQGAGRAGAPEGPVRDGAGPHRGEGQDPRQEAQKARVLANPRPLAQPLPAKVRPLSRTLAISLTPRPRWPWCPPPGRPSRPTRPGT